MRKYVIVINGIYSFGVEGKSQVEVENTYKPAIIAFYMDSNLPLVSLSVSTTKMKRKSKTVKEVIDTLIREVLLNHECSIMAFKKYIAEKSAQLAISSTEEEEDVFPMYYEEYMEQLSNGSYSDYLRCWIGSLVEQHNNDAIDILKLIIRMNLSATK